MNPLSVSDGTCESFIYFPYSILNVDWIQFIIPVAFAVVVFDWGTLEILPSMMRRKNTRFSAYLQYGGMIRSLPVN